MPQKDFRWSTVYGFLPDTSGFLTQSKVNCLIGAINLTLGMSVGAGLVCDGLVVMAVF